MSGTTNLHDFWDDVWTAKKRIILKVELIDFRFVKMSYHVVVSVGSTGL